jgi:phenol 2-monooxygenase
MPSLLLPQKGKFGLRDYEKIFSPDLRSGQNIFDMRGIDRARGGMVIVRPDQYVGHVLPLDGYAELAAYFDGFMVRADRATIGRRPAAA